MKVHDDSRVCPVCDRGPVKVREEGNRLILARHDVKIGKRVYECLGSGKNYNDYPR